MATVVNKSKPKGKQNGIYGSKMAARNIEVRAVGAWVQPEPYKGIVTEDAVVSVWNSQN